MTDYLTMREAADRLKVSKGVMRMLWNLGLLVPRIPGVRNRQTLYDTKDVEAMRQKIKKRR